MSPRSHDVIVVGGRVGGALTAAFLAARGMSVLVLESRVFPAATLSTHFFRGDGLVRCLAQLDLLDAVLELGAPKLTCQYFYAGDTTEPVRSPAQEPGDAGFCLSVQRETLDAVVADHVSRLDHVDFRNGVKVVDVVRDGDVVVGVTDDTGARHLAPVTVGADGRRSTIVKHVKAPILEEHAPQRVMYYRYVTGWTGPGGGAPDGPEFSLLENEMAYVFPSDGALACVALTVPLAQHDEAQADPAEFFRAHMERHAGLWPRLHDSAPHAGLFVGLPQPNVVRAAAGPGWALVGDAGTYQDPWSGVGMDTAARQAEALAATVTRDPADWNTAYSSARDDVTLDRFHLTVQAAPDLSVLLQ